MVTVLNFIFRTVFISYPKNLVSKRKIIYIAGLGHSGSTILDMSLGCNNKITGLGEIMAFIREKDKSHHLKSLCSCGVRGYDCEFWSKAENLIKNASDETEAYLILVNYFFEKYGNDKILVDSSKNSYPYLKTLNEKFDLKIIFLTRDYRSWAFSRSLSTGKNIGYLILRWFAENKKLEKSLKSKGIGFMRVGYEEFSLYPEIILKKICDYTGVEFSKDMLNPAKTQSHIIAGNIARVDNEKRKSIIYDARWLVSGKIIFWSTIFVFLNKFNKKRVYSNVLDKKLRPESFKIFDLNRRKELDEKFN